MCWRCFQRCACGHWWAFAVMAMVGVRRMAPSHQEISVVSCKPSRCGNWLSISTAEYVVRSSAATTGHFLRSSQGLERSATWPMATSRAVILAHAAGSSCRPASTAFRRLDGASMEEGTNTGIRGRDDPPEDEPSLDNHKSMENHMRLEESPPVVSLGGDGIVVRPRLARAIKAAMAAYNRHGPSRPGYVGPAQPRSFTPAPALPPKRERQHHPCR